MMQVKGHFNGYATNFTYVPSAGIAISLYQAEYYLSVGLISESGISHTGKKGKLSVGDTIRMSVQIGDFSAEEIDVNVISNDNPPFVFGDQLFGKNTKVTVDNKQKVIILTQRIQINY